MNLKRYSIDWCEWEHVWGECVCMCVCVGGGGGGDAIHGEWYTQEPFDQRMASTR